MIPRMQSADLIYILAIQDAKSKKDAIHFCSLHENFLFTCKTKIFHVKQSRNCPWSMGHYKVQIVFAHHHLICEGKGYPGEYLKLCQVERRFLCIKRSVVFQYILKAQHCYKLSPGCK